jgi:4-hydroxy-2-oxoheptanedioate aldolase
MGIVPRAEIQQPSQAERYRDMGVRHFCLGTDVHTLFSYWKEQGGAMRETFSAP